MSRAPKRTTLVDREPALDLFRDEVLAGLRAVPRHLPCKYFYDERGSKLFDEICELEEYYLTRTELAIMRQFGAEMAAQIGAGVRLVEYGSGSSVKTRILLDALESPVAYVPVDISREHLHRTSDRLSEAYPGIEVQPVCADFTDGFELPRPTGVPTHSAVYFPGSTIGNFPPAAATAMLARIRALCGSGGGLLIGIDLQKDVARIEAAYNDAAGVTAEFNRNLLARVRRELGAEVDVERFAHHAVYNAQEGRVELGLISEIDQPIAIGDDRFELRRGELIRTEFSYKYTIDGFAALAANAGLALQCSWTDDGRLFAVLLLAVD